ncbi:hypothetical protein FIBSPDRAFT_272700 [Athelia psychrophila]|uniref:Uncharacterized protein n=1 Tax=Athelia psychrophila TaxID=1759441 RepID=A0A165WTD1_9AGAM|nr:hypothetical protein FIBSPDRAFT_272700 [Fibularhizoctonia sp. CBS 109695]
MRGPFTEVASGRHEQASCRRRGGGRQTKIAVRAGSPRHARTAALGNSISTERRAPSWGRPFASREAPTLPPGVPHHAAQTHKHIRLSRSASIPSPLCHPSFPLPPSPSANLPARARYRPATRGCAIELAGATHSRAPLYLGLPARTKLHHHHQIPPLRAARSIFPHPRPASYRGGRIHAAARVQQAELESEYHERCAPWTSFSSGHAYATGNEARSNGS